MKPFKLAPAMKDNLWGGRKLVTGYGKQTDLPVLAESWELSAHPDGSSVVSSGPLAGTPFARLVHEHPEICGSGRQDGAFPILIKFIDAQQNLSIQVHPDDAYARRHEGEPGKNEMWVVLDSEPGAFLYFGFEHPITKEEMQRRIQDNTLTDVLHKAAVRPGDVFFIRAGTIHAIGAGILLAEVQQNSNSTYRVFDFGRTGADGKPRELHVQKALDVTTLAPASPQAPGAQPPRQGDGWTLERLAECEYFTVDRLQLTAAYTGQVGAESFLSVLCLDGSARCTASGEGWELAKGDSFFLPAGTGAFRLEGAAQLLLSRC